MKQLIHTIAAVTFFSIAVLFGSLNAQDTVSEPAQETDSACYSRGIHLFFNDQYPEAMAEFAAARDKAPENPVYCYFLGLCQLRMADETSAVETFRHAAEAEFTAKGQLVDIGEHLRRIQGPERMMIEQIRQQALSDWREKEIRRQEALYGETLSRQKELLSRNRFAAVGDEASEDGSADLPVSKTAAADDLPQVPPILPLSRPELSGNESEELAETRTNELIYLNEEVGKVSLSSAAQRRRQQRERRLLFKNPEERPAADGSKFVDIYADDQVTSDGEAFFDPNEPVETTETAAVAGETGLLSTILGKVQPLGDASAPDMEGPDIQAATTELFGEENPANPFADKPAEPAPADTMNLFEADRKFVPQP